MRQAAKLGLVVITALVGAPLLSFATYDLVVFQGRREEIRAIGQRATAEEAALPPQVVALLKASWHRSGPEPIVTRQLMRELFPAPRTAGSKLGWHLTSMMWEACIHLHLSEQEQLAIIASRSYLGHDHYGFSAEAQARYGRPLSALSQHEAATLVALSRHPAAGDVPERLARMRESLVRQAEGAGP